MPTDVDRGKPLCFGFFFISVTKWEGISVIGKRVRRNTTNGNNCRRADTIQSRSPAQGFFFRHANYNKMSVTSVIVLKLEKRQHENKSPKSPNTGTELYSVYWEKEKNGFRKPEG